MIFAIQTILMLGAVGFIYTAFTVSVLIADCIGEADDSYDKDG